MSVLGPSGSTTINSLFINGGTAGGQAVLTLPAPTGGEPTVLIAPNGITLTGNTTLNGSGTVDDNFSIPWYSLVGDSIAISDNVTINGQLAFASSDVYAQWINGEDVFCGDWDSGDWTQVMSPGQAFLEMWVPDGVSEEMLALMSEVNAGAHGVFASSEAMVGCNVVGDVISLGTVSPGNSPGAMVIGRDYTEHGTLEIEIGGTAQAEEYDCILVNRSAVIDGVVHALLVDMNDLEGNADPYEPQLGDLFDVVVAMDIDASGVSYDLPALGEGLDWDCGVVPVSYTHLRAHET